MSRDEIIQKTNELVKGLKKVTFTPEEVHFCEEIQKQRIKYVSIWNSTHGFKWEEIKGSKISRWHSDQDLWWGLLCELMVCKEYGSEDIMKEWAKDQMRQNEQLLRHGHFDCKDIGKTQVRASEYDEKGLRRVIYREMDFHTKSTQPVVGCLINTDPKNLWAVTCGFMSWEDLKNRKQEFWGDPDKRGYYAMWIPFWELTPMDKFDKKYLL